jgi:glucokinase
VSRRALIDAENAYRFQRINQLQTQNCHLALTLGDRRGIYIGGGVVGQLGGYFAQSGFRAAFDAKGRFDKYMMGIPTLS